MVTMALTPLSTQSQIQKQQEVNAEIKELRASVRSLQDASSAETKSAVPAEVGWGTLAQYRPELE